MSKPLVIVSDYINQVDYKYAGYLFVDEEDNPYILRPGSDFRDVMKDKRPIGIIGVRHDALLNVCDKYPGATESYSFNKKLRGCFANVMLFTARRASDNTEITVTSEDIEDPEKNKELMDWGFGTEVFLCVAWNQVQDMHKWYKNASTQPKMKYIGGMFSAEISPWGDDFVFATYEKIKGKRKDYE